MKRALWITLALLIATIPPAQAQLCGPVLLAGHDADDHGFEDRYAVVFDAVLSAVGNGNQGILAIGADPNSVAGDWIELVASLMTIPQPVTFVNDAAIDSVAIFPFAILFVPSDDLDTAGGIDQLETFSLNSRAFELLVFVHQGGGLFGLTQGQLVDGWDYFSDTAAQFQTRDAPPSGVLPSGDLFDDLSTTIDGLALSITDAGLDGCCFHNVFTAHPPFLQVLATANAPNDPQFHQQALILGGSRVCPILPLAVHYDQIAVRRVRDFVAVEWTTSLEDGSTGFIVYRHPCDQSSSGTAASEFVDARGPGHLYAVVDESSNAGMSCYYIQEYTVDGLGDRSQSVASEEASTSGSSSRTRSASRARR